MDATNTKIKQLPDVNILCQELGVIDIKFLPSPKIKRVNYGELTKQATDMVNVYKQFMNGDTSAPIKEIFTEE